MERDDVPASYGFGNPYVCRVNEEAVVDAVVVATTRGVAEGDSISRTKVLEVLKGFGMRFASKSPAWPTIYVFEPRW